MVSEPMSAGQYERMPRRDLIVRIPTRMSFQPDVLHLGFVCFRAVREAIEAHHS